MAVDFVKATIQGTSPLLVHNGQMANPLNEFAKCLKAITSKRIKTDQDYEEIAHIEFLGSLYHDSKEGMYLPGDNISAMVRDGARLKRRGAMVQRGVECMDLYCSLAYLGPRTPEALWDVEGFRLMAMIKNGSTGGKTARCRPIFRDWALTFQLFYQPDMINLADLRTCIDDAGLYIGLGDWRPGSPKGGRYGRFKVTAWEATNG